MTRRAGWMWTLVFAVLLGTATTAARAQDATSGSISGTVTDANGALIKGATVTLTNTDRNQVQRTVSTNENGFYTAASLPLGRYTVAIQDAGFKSVKVTGVMLNVSDALTIS